MKTPAQIAEIGNEFSHQVALFAWCNVAAQFGVTAANDPLSYTERGYAASMLLSYRDALPELAWLYAVKNAGHGDAIRGARSAAEGVKAGVPDLCLPVPIVGNPFKFTPERASSRYHGLYLELKRPGTEHKRKGVGSDGQNKWQAFLKSAGYAVEVCFGWEPARDVLLSYLKGI